MTKEEASHLHELLEMLEAGVLTLDRGGTDPVASVHRLFQSAHNLKSGLAMAGLDRASKLFHAMEDGLDDIRRGRLTWSVSWADAVLDTVDRVKACVDQNDDALEPSFSVFDRDEKKTAPSSPLSPREFEAARMAAKAGKRLFRIEKLFLPGLTKQEFEGHIIYDDIRDNGELQDVRPGWDEYSRVSEEVVVRFLFSSASTHQELSQLFFDPLIELTLPPSPPRFRVLVVDDEPTTLRLIEAAIAGLGDITTATDGTEGVEEFRRAFDLGAPFDVVILDLGMPQLDGHGTLQTMRQFEESCGIFGLDRCLVFINTSSQDYDKVRVSFRFQADRYLIKPLSVTAIKDQLEGSLPWLETRRRGLP